MPVYMEETIMELGTIYINGGRKGFLVGISPLDAKRVSFPGSRPSGGMIRPC